MSKFNTETLVPTITVIENKLELCLKLVISKVDNKMIEFKVKNEQCRIKIEQADQEVEKKLKEYKFTQEKLEKSAQRM